ncbi:AAA family ATPase [Engelhardtia mirabilis]|uniref:Aminoglycoside phosphotransferase domain-containing protein n=1 Tax=Engelhardtia mirabilis TaxID=2528011 RepID=A0A518BRE9_9BACT|nr:hypothetical protein Pla133_46750 [Planctomycetes bacterium Pla133]QDV03881.1 hypothetical protein Pla86_46730 [Planctomycetes bacterium Pla86]
MLGQNPLRTLLDDGRLYPDGQAPERFVETHISVLAFARDLVYKVKKPVDLGFVDFTTAQRRLHFCAEELRLNARISPEMYLGVARLTRGEDGAPRFGPPGPPPEEVGEALDFAVVMRCLPERGMLDAALDRGEIDNGLLERLANTLVDFHASAERGPQVDAHAEPAAVAGVVQANFDDTRDLVGDLLAEEGRLATPELHAHVEAAARDFLANHAELLEARIAAGRVVDGHGDLHAGNVCVVDEHLWIYDCVEFELAFRAGDVACDLAFLCMDLDLRGYRAFAAYLARRYADLAEDAELARLLPFYKGYRAMVRAKVEAIGARDPDRPPAERAGSLARARRHFNLAASYTLPPALILTCGLPATGKSWMGERVAQALGGPIHKSDVRRKQLAGLAIGNRQREGYDQGLYTPQNKQLTYDSLLADARADLLAGRSVVIDGSFVQAKWRVPFRDLAAELDAPMVLLEMRADEETIKRRIEKRLKDPHEPSEADFNVYLALRDQWEEPDELEPEQHLVVDAGGSTEAAIGRLLDRIRGLARGQSDERGAAD